jgi:hypothetical protein
MSGSLTGTHCVSDTESSLGGLQETFEVDGLDDRCKFGLTHRVDWSELLAGALLQEDETGYRVRYTLASKLVNELVVGVRLRLRRVRCMTHHREGPALRPQRVKQLIGFTAHIDRFVRGRNRAREFCLADAVNASPLSKK